MLFQNLLIAFSLSAMSLAQNNNNNNNNNNNDDVPRQCQQVCSNVASNENRCDAENDDNRQGYLDCICQIQNASTEIPTCAACVNQFDDDGADNDFNELVSACSLAATTFNPSATATSGAPQSTGDAPASTTSAGTGSETQGPSQTSEAPGEQTSNAANGLSVQGLGAAVGLGCMVWGAM